MALSQISSSQMTCGPTGPQSMISGSRAATSAADGAIIERRTRINQPDDENARCKVSRAPDRHKDFSQCIQQSTTPSTSNVISHRQERTEPSGHRRCRHGKKSSPRRESNVPTELLRAQFANVTKPAAALALSPKRFAASFQLNLHYDAAILPQNDRIGTEVSAISTQILSCPQIKR